MERTEKLELFAVEVEKMRDAQKKYFKIRSDENLRTSKYYEHRVDVLIGKLNTAQNELKFDSETNYSVSVLTTHRNSILKSGEKTIQNGDEIVAAINTILERLAALESRKNNPIC